MNKVLKKIIVILTLILIMIVQTGVISAADYIVGIKAVRNDPERVQKPINSSSYQGDSIPYAYRFGVPGVGGMPAKTMLWKLIDYTSGTANWNTAIYCLDQGKGFITDTGTFAALEAKRVTYNISEVMAIRSQVSPVLHSIENATTNNRVLWILDHCFLPKSENRTEARKAFLTDLLAFYRANNNYATIGGLEDEFEMYTVNSFLITDNDIEAVQQAAIWYFTNFSDSSDWQNLPTIFLDTVGDSSISGSFSLDLGSINLATNQEGYKRNLEAQLLYKYFITEAKKDSVLYNTTRDLAASIAMNGTNPKVIGISGGVKAGPFNYTVTENSKTVHSYVLEVKVKTTSNPTSTLTTNYTIKKTDGTVITNISDVKGTDFYIEIPDSTVTSVEIKVKAKYDKRDVTYWTVSGRETLEQPIAIVKNETLDIEAGTNAESFDLALRKFIISVNGTLLTGADSRVPAINTLALEAGTTKTATYTHTKTPKIINVGDKIVYTIRVYNEGGIDGKATSIVDYLPTGLKLATSSSINTSFGWVPDGTGKIVTTDYLKNTTIKAFNKTKTAVGGETWQKAGTGTSGLYYADVQIECEVIAALTTQDQTFRNIAEIKSADNIDRDSTPGNVDINSYTPPLDNSSYQQDDDDYEDVKLLGQLPDLALRKFISSVDGLALTGTDSRVPVINTTNLENGSATTAIYTHSKTPKQVAPGSKIVYTIRVYNEGMLDGKATSIVDYLPTGLKLATSSSINTSFGWVLDGTGKIVTTDYLKNTTIKSFNKTKTAAGGETWQKAGTGASGLYYADVQIECEVTASFTTQNQTLRNIAEIKSQDNPDRDSAPGNVDINSYTPPLDNSRYQEDDDDYEDLILPAQQPDLALRKFITSVKGTALTDTDSRVPAIDTTNLENGSATTATYTHSKTAKVVATGDKVIYTIRVYNEGVLDGKATSIVDYLPAGLKLATGSSINTTYGWVADGTGRIITTDYLKNTTIKAFNKTKTIAGGETWQKAGTGTSGLYYADVQVECEVTATATSQDQNLRNIAEIKSQDNPDRDSAPGNVDINSYTPPQDNSRYQEDDDDYEQLVLPGQALDLSLRKFITQLNGTTLTDIADRTPVINTTNLENGTAQTAIYTHSKTPVAINVKDKIVYTIRVYNEGGLDGKATSIVDYLPTGLKLAENSSINTMYGWTLDGTGRVITTDYLKNTTIKAFNRTKLSAGGETWQKAGTGTSGLYYADVQIECEVVAELAAQSQTFRNIAEIKEDDGDDRDSTPGNVDINDYTPPANNSEYQQDDDDYEDIILPPGKFDLALRKFITVVRGTELVDNDSRIPVIDTTKLEDNSEDTAKYTHSKLPVEVNVGDKIVYTIRVYNEGGLDGKATSIVDYLPAGLKLAENSSINTSFGWVLDGTGRVITTDYLKDTTIKAFNKTKTSENTGETWQKAANGNSGLYYADVQIECEVVGLLTSKDQTLRNIAEIKKDDGDDRDSNPDNVDLDNYTPPSDNSNYQQDDDDYEDVIIKGKTFDLALRKFITSVKDGVVEKEVTDRIPQVSYKDGKIEYNHAKEPLIVKDQNIVTYTIRVYNEGEQDGYAKEIIDNVPQGLEFLPENETNKKYGWSLSEDGNKVTTDYLSKERSAQRGEDSILKAFDKNQIVSDTNPDYQDVKIAFKVVEDKKPDNGSIINIAEISDDSDKDGKDIDDDDSTPGNNKPDEDDIDTEKIHLKVFDLALRKFITSVNGGSTEKEVKDRIPQVSYKDGIFTYAHTKEPIVVEDKNVVTYTIRVYNEGEINGYAKEITDNIPQGLEFLPENETNKKYGWSLSEDKTKITTDYLSKEKSTQRGEDNLLKAFDKDQEVSNTNPDYRDVKVAFKVIKENTPDGGVIINIAEISDDSDENGKDIKDKDSIPGNNNPDEDDIDTEKVILEEKAFDLSLRKFITGVKDLDAEKEVTDRTPKVSYKDGKFTYDHTKEPVVVANTNIVTYTIRVYNEGGIDGYAKEVRDNIPDGLVYLPEHEINKKYGWKVSEDGKTIRTDYLSKEQSELRGEDNLIKAFDKTKEVSDKNPDYRDVKVAFRVDSSKMGTDRVVKNTAEISKHSDKDGKDIPDRDSVPDNNKPGEDDIDTEEIKVKKFDLSLLKYVSKVITIENGKTTVRETGYNGLENPEPIVKVDLHRKKINDVTVKFGYTIKVTNEGEIAGYAKEIKDYIPEGLKFLAEDNPDWKVLEDQKVYSTDKLKDTLLKPGESATVEIVLTWVNNENNMGQKTNTAEISKDYNDYGEKDIDSTPDNKKEGEDDIDYAHVILSISTGVEPVYVGMGTVVLAIIAGGLFLIKRYVL